MKRKYHRKYMVFLFFSIICMIGAMWSSPAGMIGLSPSPQLVKNISQGNDWWSMFRHDETHRGLSTTNTRDDSHVIWSYQTNFIVSSSPAVSHGRVYVGSWDWNLYCLDMDSGNLLWNYSTTAEITSSPVVVNGKVYVGSQDTKLYCLNAMNGSFLWSYKTDFIIDSSPIVVDDKVIFGSSDGSLYCLDTYTGILLWKHQTNSVIISSPAVVDGKVYVGVTNGDFLCLNSTTGNVVWTRTMTEGTYSSPSYDDGKIYFGSNDENVYCLDANDGRILWNYSTLSEIQSSPAVAYDSVYIGTSDGRLLCLNKNTGGYLWSYQISGSVESSPAVADGKVYFSTNPCCGFTSYMICLNAYTGTKVWDYNFNTQVQTKSSPALAAGKVFVGSGDGKVFAFGDIVYLADANGPYFGVVNTSLDFTGSVFGGQPDFSWHWDFGDGWTSTQQNPTHTYTSAGEYTITLTITDGLGHIATDETVALIEIPNVPPEIPVVDGPTTGKPGESAEFSFTSLDINNDRLLYYVDWGDNMTTGWIGLFYSGAIVYRGHAWSEKGSFLIKAKAKDHHGAESNWSEPFEITITAPELAVEIKGGIGITITLRNIGNAPATNVHWNATFDGVFVIPSFRNLTMSNIMPGGKVSERILIFGFGKMIINVTAISDEKISVIKNAQATLLLFFVVGVK